MTKSKIKYKLIVIGASAGGMGALSQIFMRLSPKLQVPILVVLHIGDNSMKSLISYLQKSSNLLVEEAKDKICVKKGHIYIAPPNYHLLIDKNFCIMLSDDEKVNFSRPSIDVLFQSAGLSFRESLIGVILTGANNDGAVGLKYIKQLGGYTIGQDPKEAVMKIMPSSAIKLYSPNQILTLDEIGTNLNILTKKIL